jgi:hypothetical protein
MHHSVHLLLAVADFNTNLKKGVGYFGATVIIVISGLMTAKVVKYYFKDDYVRIGANIVAGLLLMWGVDYVTNGLAMLKLTATQILG